MAQGEHTGGEAAVTQTLQRQERPVPPSHIGTVARKRRTLISYIFAFFSTTSISSLSLIPEEDLWGERAPFAAFMLVITLSGILGGLWPALLATALSGLSTAYFFLAPRESLEIHHTADRMLLVLFLASGALVAGATARLHGAVAQSRTDRDALVMAHHALEEKVAERTAELEALLANAPVGFSFFDRTGRYLRINTHFAEISGATADAHINKTLREMVPDLADTIEPIVKKVFSTGEAARGIEIPSDAHERP